VGSAHIVPDLHKQSNALRPLLLRQHPRVSLDALRLDGDWRLGLPAGIA
jgi:hypothetical protein